MKSLVLAIVMDAILVAGAAGQVAAPDVSVELLVLADAPQPTVVFRVVNTGTTEIKRGNLGMDTNRLALLSPDGTVNRFEGFADPAMPVRKRPRPHTPVIAPGEAFSWEHLVSDFIRSNDQPGTYRLYWEFGGVLSEEVRLLRRAEFTLAGRCAPTDRRETQGDRVAEALLPMAGRGPRRAAPQSVGGCEK